MDNSIEENEIKKSIPLCHISNKNKTYLVNQKAINKSKSLKIFDDVNNCVFTVRSGNEDAMIFIVKYLNYYKDIEEIPAPEFPLPENISLLEIFEDESHIFDDLLIFDKTNPDCNKKQDFIQNLLQIAEELQIDILFDKLSAILCYYIL